MRVKTTFAKSLVSVTNGHANTPAPARRYYYAGHKNCYGRIHANELENAVVNAVTDFLTEENCTEIARKAYELYEKERNNNPELDAAKKELASVNTKLQNAMNALMSGFKSTTLQETVADMEKHKSMLEKEISRLNKKAPAFKPEHFEYFIQKYKTFKQNENDRRSLIETFVNRIIVYSDKAVILINLTDNTKTPPLQQVTAALERCSDNVAVGDPYGN